MDDLTGQLNKILSDPQSMAQIQGMMSSLGLGGTAQENQNNTNTNNNNNEPSQTNISQNLSSLLSSSNSSENSSNSNLDMMSTIAKIAPLLNTVQQDDNSTRLLTALKPMLSDKRQDKITQAVRILQLMKLMPLIKDSGMLSQILGGLF